MTLGRMLEIIEPHKNKNGYVQFDFGDIIPCGIDSWRGIYAELALKYKIKEYSDEYTPKDLYNLLKGAIGKTFTGYKGGKYIMDEHTKVHIDNYGQYTGTCVDNIRVDTWHNGDVNITIQTSMDYD